MTTETEVLGGFAARLAEYRNEDTIRETLQELQRQHAAARDFNVPQGGLRMELLPEPFEADGEETPKLSIDLEGLPPMVLDVSAQAHAQLGIKLGIHGTYYRKMLDAAPDLLRTNVNHWAERFEGSIKVRELDGHARAVLSPRYRALDNMPLVAKSIPEIERAGGKVVKLRLDEDNFFMEALVADWAERIDHQWRDVREEGAVFQSWLADSEEGYFHRYTERARNIPDEDWVVPGIVERNSETGKGGITVQPKLLRVICLNGTTIERTYKRIHLGAAEQDGMVESDEVRRRENDLIFAQVAEVVRKTFDRDEFRRFVELMTDATRVTLGNAKATIERVQDAHGLTDEETQSVVNRILFDGDPTTFGLVQAVTSLARDTEDLYRQWELEQVGGRLLEDPDKLVVVRR